MAIDSELGGYDGVQRHGRIVLLGRDDPSAREQRWASRAALGMVVKFVDPGAHTFRGVASTITADRMGDEVDPRGAQYTLPLPLLWQHDAKLPIGTVTAATVTGHGIEVTCSVATVPSPGPLHDRLADAWTQISSGMVRGLSIGFIPLASEPLPNGRGNRISAWDWIELSAVTVPANAEAGITATKASNVRATRAADGSYKLLTGYRLRAKP